MLKLELKLNQVPHLVLPVEAGLQILAETYSRRRWSDHNMNGFAWPFSGIGHIVQDRFEGEFWNTLKIVCEEIISGKIEKANIRTAQKKFDFKVQVPTAISINTRKSAQSILTLLQKHSEQLVY